MARTVVVVAGRKLDVEQLVTSSEIAGRLGIRHLQTVHNWAERFDDFPRAVIRRERFALWYWPDVERWAKRTGRSPKAAPD